MHSVGKSICHVQVPTISTILFWKPQKFRVQLSSGKIMGIVLWNSRGVIQVDVLPRDVTIKAQYYSNLLSTDVHQATGKKNLGYHQRKSSNGMTAKVHVRQT